MVVVTISTDDQTDAGPEQLTFTTTDWDTPQTVTFVAVDDEVLEEDHLSTISHRASSGDEKYDGLTNHQIVSVHDNECGMWAWLDSDVDHDCDVDIYDLAEFATAWLGCTTPHEAGCQNEL